MGHLIFKFELRDSGRCVAAADYRYHFKRGDIFSDLLGPLGEFIHLEDAERAVPDDRLRALQDILEYLDRLRADIEPHPAVRDLVADYFRVFEKRLRDLYLILLDL